MFLLRRFVRSPKVNVPETELNELRRRIIATRWPGLLSGSITFSCLTIEPGHP